MSNVSGSFVTVDASYEAVVTVVALLFVVGTFLVFLPQIYEIVKHRHTVGISFFSLWIANMNGFSGGWNIIMLNAQALHDCGKDALACINTVSVVLQILLSWIMPFVIYICYLIFFVDIKYVDIKRPSDILDKRPNESLRWTSREWYIVIFSTIVYIIFFIVLVVIYIPLAVVYGINGNITLIYAESIGYVTAALNVVQWMPQIILSIRRKNSGSFSILSLILMTPGTFAQAVLLIVENQNISAWITFIIAGVQQIILIAILIYFDYIHKWLIKYRENRKVGMIHKVDTMKVKTDRQSTKISDNNQETIFYKYNGCDDEFAIYLHSKFHHS